MNPFKAYRAWLAKLKASVAAANMAVDKAERSIDETLAYLRADKVADN